MLFLALWLLIMRFEYFIYFPFLALSLSLDLELAILPQRALAISKMNFSHWRPPGVSERMWSVNFDGPISREYQTLGGLSGLPSE
jgi:hypothetical protein